MKIAAGALLVIGLACLGTSVFMSNTAAGSVQESDEEHTKRLATARDLHSPAAEKMSEEEVAAKKAELKKFREANEAAKAKRARMKTMLRVAGVVLALAGAGGLLWAGRQE